MYGGSMFLPSAASDTLQGKAIHAINERWGYDFRKWVGRETIGIPVCKKKYSPFDIRVKKGDTNNTPKKKKGQQQQQIKVVIERMYGCACHSPIRKQLIEKYGERKGWEPFGQWSLSKAMTLARKMIDKFKTGLLVLQGDRNIMDVSGKTGSTTTTTTNNSDEEDEVVISWKSICHNGKCAWKIKSKYDDVTQDENEGIIVS